jgi:hypothetical protein
MKILTKLGTLEHEIAELRRLERKIPKLKGEKREEALKTYRELMWDFKDEPIYLARYE